MLLSQIFAGVYAVAVVPVALSTIVMVAMAVITLVPRRRREAMHNEGALPFVSVIVPVFDDPVAARCVEACLAFRYPADRYEIVVLDDSTDPTTRARVDALAAEATPSRAAVIVRRRATREGYKPGALAAAMSSLEGEILAIFDADFVPAPDVLTALVAPFADPRIAIVQARQGFIGEEQSLVSRFAACLLSIHHHVMIEASCRFGVVFFCGTAGALRRSAIDDAGGWNTKSITEDADLSVRLLARGWQATYLPLEVPGEVPATLRAFLRQQMRWCFGGVRVFFDHASLLFGPSALRVSQRALVAYFTLGNVVAVAVAAMTVAGLASWIGVALGMASGLDGRAGIACTLGFVLVAALALRRRGRVRDVAWAVLGACTVAIPLAFVNALAALRAIASADKPLYASTSWICTPKVGNREIEESVTS